MEIKVGDCISPIQDYEWYGKEVVKAGKHYEIIRIAGHPKTGSIETVYYINEQGVEDFWAIDTLEFFFKKLTEKEIHSKKFNNRLEGVLDGIPPTDQNKE